MKKWLSTLLALAIVFTLLPARAMGADGGEEEPRLFGHISSGNEYTYPTAEEVRAALPGLRRGALPARFDAREHGWITPVKNQAYNGLCWAFGTTAALEANMKKNGMGEQDFSERHMGYSTSTYRYNGKVVNANQGFAFYFGGRGGVFDTIQNGGNREIASAYYMRGTSLSGAVLESEDPYKSYESANRDPAITASKHKVFSAWDIMFLTGSNKATSDEVTLIKNAIMTYGALDSAMHANDSRNGEPDSKYYNASKAAFYYNGDRSPNHEVLLIGWDDNFSRNNFNTKPTNDGAWLVKNSWGTDWGDRGYFWISYEDTQYPKEVSTFTGADAWNSDMYMYESDYTATGDTPWWSSANEYAKVFTITAAGQEIDSVRFFVPSGGSVTASADVIADFTGFDNYRFSAKGSRTITYPGWYTLRLDTPVRLPSSGKFAVVLHLDGASKLVYDNNGNNSFYESYWMQNGKMTTANYNWALKAIASQTNTGAPSVSGTVTGAGELTATVTAPSGTKLFAASYAANGRLLDARTVTLTRGYNNEEITFRLAAGKNYRLMLLDGATFAPLCPVWNG